MTETQGDVIIVLLLLLLALNCKDRNSSIILLILAIFDAFIGFTSTLIKFFHH